MTREEEEKLKMLSLEDEEEEKPSNRRTSFFAGRSATAPSNLQQKIVTPEIAEAQASYNDSLVKAEKEFENIKSNSNRDQLVDYYKAYADTVERDIKNQDQERYNVDKTILSLIDGELKKTAGVGTFLQDTGAEAWRSTKLGLGEQFRNVAKAHSNMETSTDGFNVDTLYQIASSKPGTELSKIGQKSMTGSYAEAAYKKLTDLYNAHPDDRTIADIYGKVTKQGYSGDKDYFKNVVPYLNQVLKQDRYNNSVLVRNTNDEIYDVQKLKEREMLSDYGDNLFLQGVGVAGNMVPSVLEGIATAGIAGLPAASSAIASNAARGGAVGALSTNIGVSGKIAQAGALGSMYMSAAGRAFDDTINAGYDWDKASLYSQLIGALEVTTEMIGGESVMGWLSGRVGGTALGKATQALVKKGGNAISRFVIGMTADVGSEIIEEEISALVEPIIDKAVLGKDTTIEEYLQSALDAATGTAIPTLIMGGLGKARIASSITKTQTRLNAKIDALLSSNAITKEEATKLKGTVANWTKDIVEGVYEHEEEIKTELATKKVTQTYDEAMANINKQLNSMLVGNNIVKNPEYATTREIRDLGTKTTATYSNTDTIQSDMDYIQKSNPSIKSIKPATTISKAHQNVKNLIEKVTGKQVVFADIENTGDEFDYGFTNKSGNNLYLNSNLDIADTLAAGFHEAGHHFATKYSDLFQSFKSKVSKSKLATLKSKAVFKGLSEDGILEELFGNYLGSTLTNAKMTKKLEASTQSLVDSMKDMFSFASKNKNTKVSKYNVDFTNYLGEAIINDKALEKEVLRTFMGNAKQQQKKAEPVKQQAKEAPKRLEKPTQKEEKKNDGNTEKKVAKPTEKTNNDKKATPKKEQTKQEAKVEKKAETKKEPPKKLEPKNTLKERLVGNMVKQLSEMEITQENIEEVLGETLDSATERQMEKLYEQYNTKDKSFNDLYDKMYEDVEKALKKSSDVKYSREFLDDYSEETKKRILSSKNAVIIDNYQALRQSVDEALLDGASNKALHLGRINEEVIKEIRKKIKNLPKNKQDYLSIRPYDLVIRQSEIRHLKDNKTRVTNDDIQFFVKSLPSIITESDAVAYDKNGSDEGLRFKKKLADGKYISFVLVSNKHHTFKVKSISMAKSDFETKKRSLSPPNGTEKVPNNTPKASGLSTSFDNSIIQPKGGDVNIRYSRTITEDNDGKELTKGQQEWNEGNQVIDSKGRLKHLYHGTNNGEFYVFDKELANAEGDWGAGFYFTDNEMDVNENYYGGGPDFEVKVDKLAEHIQEQSPTEMSYAVARERARKMLEKGEYRIDAYGKMLNPAIVGKTRLFEYFTEDLDVYREDYSSDDDYEEALIYALYDKVDEMIDEAALYVDNQTGGNVEFGDYKTIKSDISQVIAENVIEPGSGIEMEKFKDELVDRLLDAGKYDNNGTWQSYANEIVRLIIQSLGYDGIIDPTVSKKFRGMNLDSNTTHYIFFEPNQIKDVDNLNPTDNPDIRYSRNQSQSVKEMLSNIRMTENEDETETFVDNTFVRIMRRINREIFNNAEALVQFDNKVAKAMGKRIADVPTFLKLFDNWRRAGNADSIIAQIGKGAYNEDTGKQITKGLANILGDLMPSRKEAKAMGMSRDEAMQQRIEQLIALGTAERVTELDERGIESGIDVSLAEEVIEEYKDDEELHKALDEIRADGNALIDYSVEKHVLQEETAKYIKENNLLYFPFNRVLGEDTTRYGLGKKDGAVGRAIVGIKGSNLMLENPLVSIVGNWARMLQVIDQQTMVEKLKEAGKYLGDEQELWFKETKPLVKYQGEVGMDVFKGNIAKQLEALGYDEIVDRLDWSGLYQLFVPEKSDPKKMTISYFDEQGKRRYIKFEDNDYGRPMYDIISNLNPLQSNKFLDFVNVLSQGVRLGATTMNWEFALGNMMSDSAQAYLYTEGFVVPLISSIFDIFKLGVGRGYIPTFKKDYKSYYEKYKRSGASLSGQFRGNAKYIRGKSDEVFGFREDQLFNPNEDVKANYWLGPVSLANKNGRKALRKKISNAGNTIVNFMQFVPEYSEEATRFAEFVRVYDKLKKKGWDEIDAIKEAGIKAREITQDFSIQGNTMKDINKIIPFSAATMGGLYRFGRELKTHPVRLTSRLIPMAAFVILMLETFRDDDDRKWYEEMNKQKKYDNYVINNGTSEPFIIKKPQGPARYFVNFIELIYNIANGYVEEDKIDEAVKEWAEMSIKDQLPITNASDFVPGGLQAFLENQINQDFYYGTKIVPQTLEHLDPRNQYDENTSEFSKALGNIFNWSPLKIDNVVKSSFAGLGKLFLSATDDLAAQFGANEKPAKRKGERYIIDKFYANALKNPESVNYVYDRLDELENEKAEGRMTGKEQREYEKLTTSKSTLADINKEIREIKSNEKLSAEKKTDKIEDLQELKVDVARYYQGKSLIEKSNKSKIELMEYYPSQDTYTYTVDKNNKVELDFSSKATKTEYAKKFQENYNKSLEELKATQEYKQATPIEKIELEKNTKTKARTKTTNDMKKIVYERTKR